MLLTFHSHFSLSLFTPLISPVPNRTDNPRFGRTHYIQGLHSTAPKCTRFSPASRIRIRARSLSFERGILHIACRFAPFFEWQHRLFSFQSCISKIHSFDLWSSLPVNTQKIARADTRRYCRLGVKWQWSMSSKDTNKRMSNEKQRNKSGKWSENIDDWNRRNALLTHHPVFSWVVSQFIAIKLDSEHKAGRGNHQHGLDEQRVTIPPEEVRIQTACEMLQDKHGMHE